MESISLEGTKCAVDASLVLCKKLVHIGNSLSDGVVHVPSIGSQVNCQLKVIQNIGKLTVEGVQNAVEIDVFDRFKDISQINWLDCLYNLSCDVFSNNGLECFFSEIFQDIENAFSLSKAHKFDKVLWVLIRFFDFTCCVFCGISKIICYFFHFFLEVFPEFPFSICLGLRCSLC